MDKKIKQLSIPILALMLGVGINAQEKKSRLLDSVGQIRTMSTTATGQLVSGGVILKYGAPDGVSDPTNAYLNDYQGGSSYNVFQEAMSIIEDNGDGTVNMELIITAKPVQTNFSYNSTASYFNIAVGTEIAGQVSKEFRADAVYAEIDGVPFQNVVRGGEATIVNKLTSSGGQGMFADTYSFTREAGTYKTYTLYLLYKNVSEGDLFRWGAGAGLSDNRDQTGTFRDDSTPRISNSSSSQLSQIFEAKANIDIMDQYKLYYTQPSVSTRNDAGFRWSEDGKILFYYYDIDNPTVFTEDDLLLQLKAVGGRGELLGAEKGYAEQRLNGYSQDGSYKYYLDNRNVEILDVVAERDSYGGHSVNTNSVDYRTTLNWSNTGNEVASLAVPARNADNGGTLTGTDVATILNTTGQYDYKLIDSSLGHHKIYATPQAAHLFYPASEREITHDVVNFYTIGYRRTEIEKDILEQYDLSWINQSVAGRDDVGFQWSEDGKSIIYYYDEDDKTNFNIHNLLQQLQAKEKESGRILNPGEKGDATVTVEKQLAEANRVSEDNIPATGYAQSTGDPNRYWIDGKNVEILDVINPINGYGGEPLRSAGNGEADYDIEARNGASAFTITPVDNTMELVEGTVSRQQVYATKPTANQTYTTVDARNTTTDVVNLYTVGYRKKNVCVKPATTTGTALETKMGITDLGRAGETPNAWPMLRKGGWIALESNNKGFVITRMSESEINALTPQEGMMVYDETNKCLKLYDGTSWSCFTTPSCPTE